MEADKAVAIALIVNELATNSFKYAFGINAGKISLKLKAAKLSRLSFEFSDSGAGIKEDARTKLSFGLRLVKLMAAQLGSELVLKTESGTHYAMEIEV